MKKIRFCNKYAALLIALIIGFVSEAQQLQRNTAFGFDNNRGRFRNTLWIPYGPVPVYNGGTNNDSVGAIFFNTTDTALYVHNGTRFVKMGGSGSGGAINSIFGRTGTVTAQVGDYSAFYYPIASNPSGYFTAATAYNQTQINARFGGATPVGGYNKTNWDAAFSWGNHAGLYPTISRFLDTAAALRAAIGTGGTGSGNMLKSVYDTDDDGVVDNAELLAGLTSTAILNRANHTGVQAISTITGLQTALDGKQPQLSGTGFIKITGTTISYDNSSYTPTSRTINGQALTSNVVLTTTNIDEGTNLYYTTPRVQAVLDANPFTLRNSLAAGSNLLKPVSDNEAYIRKLKFIGADTTTGTNDSLLTVTITAGSGTGSGTVNTGVAQELAMYNTATNAVHPATNVSWTGSEFRVIGEIAARSGNSIVAYNADNTANLGLTMDGNNAILGNGSGDINVRAIDNINFITYDYVGLAYTTRASILNNGTFKLNNVLNDNTETNLVTWNATDKVFEYRTVASLPGTGGTPGGSDREIQFNNGGAFGASVNLRYPNAALSRLEVNNAIIQNYNDDGTVLGNNVYLNDAVTAFIAKKLGASTWVQVAGGSFLFRSGASVAAGATITPIEIAGLSSSGFALGTGVTATQKLDVAGNVKFTGALMPGGASGTSGQVLKSQGAGVAPIWAAESSAYTLPIASATVLGGIKVGAGLAIDAGGVLSAGAGSPANLALGVATLTTQPVTNSNGTGFTLPTFSTTAGLVPGTATGTTLFLRQDGTWQTPAGGSATTINANAASRIITGSATANTLNAESDATWDGTKINLSSAGATGLNIKRSGTNNAFHLENYFNGLSYFTQNVYRSVADGNWYPDVTADGSAGMIFISNSTILPNGITFIADEPGTTGRPTTRMRIRADGEVDINNLTDQGAFHLQVGGNIWSSGGVTLAGLSDATGVAKMMTINNGVVSYQAIPTGTALTTTDNNLSISGSFLSTKKAWTAITWAATITVNAAATLNHKVTLGGNTTVNFSNGQDGDIIALALIQDATGSRLVTWETVVDWSRTGTGTAPTLKTAANGQNLITFQYDATTLKWYGIY